MTGTFSARSASAQVLFQRIYEDGKDVPFFQQRISETGQLPAHPLNNIVGVLRVLSYSEKAHRAEEYVRLSSLTIRQAQGHRTHFIVNRHQSSYRGKPTIDELRDILARNEMRGVPG